MSTYYHENNVDRDIIILLRHNFIIQKRNKHFLQVTETGKHHENKWFRNFLKYL